MDNSPSVLISLSPAGRTDKKKYSLPSDLLKISATKISGNFETHFKKTAAKLQASVTSQA